ncbi:hypothetical protein WMY93_004590 [Mugilogobius chulae]|uniref:Uncharacterized protein n=1 Tax=Mugilogobius chulae TaxID=88201 RepID=A0AAW0PXH7_9GOBI
MRDRSTNQRARRSRTDQSQSRMQPQEENNDQSECRNLKTCLKQVFTEDKRDESSRVQTQTRTRTRPRTRRHGTDTGTLPSSAAVLLILSLLLFVPPSSSMSLGGGGQCVDETFCSYNVQEFFSQMVNLPSHINERSLASWSYVQNIDLNRVPQVIHEAGCHSSHSCRSLGGRLRSGDGPGDAQSFRCLL